MPSPGEEGRRTGFNSLLDQFHVHALLGRSLASSQWLRGLLVESRGAVSDALEQWGEVRRNEEGNIVTALFNISLAGDSKGVRMCLCMYIRVYACVLFVNHLPVYVHLTEQEDFSPILFICLFVCCLQVFFRDSYKDMN